MDIEFLSSQHCFISLGTAGSFEPGEAEPRDHSLVPA
jgi:hypothetical protein